MKKFQHLSQLKAVVSAAALVVGMLPMSALTAGRSLMPPAFPMQDLGTIGGTLSQGKYVNDNGIVIGENITVTNPTTYRSFVYVNGVMTNLPMVGDGSNSFAAGINSNGDIIGNFSGNGVARGFLYKNGVMAEMPTLGGSYSSALDINDNGDVVGSSHIAGDTAGHAVLYKNGQLTDLGTLGGRHSTAKAKQQQRGNSRQCSIGNGRPACFSLPERRDDRPRNPRRIE